MQELQEMFGNNVKININISECREFARSFHTSDFNSSITPDLMAQDHSLRQFYEILTNQYGLRRLGLIVEDCSWLSYDGECGFLMA